MATYSSEFKAQIVSEYLNGNISQYALSAKYDVTREQITAWVNLFKLSGPQSLVRRHSKRFFNLEFKLNVINYYQTHEESLAEVGAKFDLLPSQISIWTNALIRDGIEALKPHQKGRPSKVKKTKKQVRHLAQKNEVERLKEELAKKNQELHEAKLELAVTKKSLALFGPSKQKPKRK